MKAIPTKYKGVSYRSRLEARWAVVFEAMGLEYVYEPEGFENDGEVYLPDFWVGDPWCAYVAIKPTPANDTMQKNLEKEFEVLKDMFFQGEVLLVIVGHPQQDKFRIYAGTVLNPTGIRDVTAEVGISASALELAMSERFGERRQRHARISR
jgi:hypothetical protein